MAQHKAPDELLFDFVSGALPEGPSLAVALHVALDPTARGTVRDLQALGGALLDRESMPPTAGDDGLELALARLDSVAVEPRLVSPGPPEGFEWAPAPLLPYLGPASRWRKTLGGFESIPLAMRGDSHQVALVRLTPGHGLPKHHHTGNEYTVVMHGSYSDAFGTYRVGDFAVGPGAEDHEPVGGAEGGACVALIVVEKPIVLSGTWGRLLNPFVKRGWLLPA
jgi:putative transcriptional regulator